MAGMRFVDKVKMSLEGDNERSHSGLHVARSAAEDSAIYDLSAECVRGPRGRADGHGVEVPGEDQWRGAKVTPGRDEARASAVERLDAHMHPGRRQSSGQELGRQRLRLPGRVEADEGPRMRHP